MKKICLLLLGILLFGVAEVNAQGCAAVYARKVAMNANGQLDTTDFTAAELNNGIQMQCGMEYYLIAETFAPGGSSNYVYEEIPYNPPFAFNSGTEYVLPRDDCWGMIMSLGFNRPPEPPGTPNFQFSFYGNSYSSCVIGSNGLLSFDLSEASQTPACEKTCSYSQGEGGTTIPSTSRYKNAVYGPYHDIYFQESRPTYPGHMYFQIIDDYPCRKIVLSFYEVPLFGNTSQIATHMMVLYETTNVIEYYLQNKPCCTSTNGGNSTLGIHNATGTQATTITNSQGQSYNTTEWTAQNEAWRIKPSGQLESYGVEWKKRSATDFNAPMVEVSADADGVLHVQVSPEEGPTRFFSKNIILREDGEEFEVWDSSAVYYPIDMPDITVTHPDTVCRGEIVNFQLSGGGDNGRYYMMSPYNDPNDTTNYTTDGVFNYANDPNGDLVDYRFKVENYDQFGTLVCTRYINTTVHNVSFEVALVPDFNICKGTPVVLTDELKDGAGTCSWSNGMTGDTITFTPEQTTTIVLTKTNNIGCSATDEVIITVDEAPEVEITGTMSICEGTATILRANINQEGCILLWDNGETSNEITVAPTSTQDYTLSVKLPPAMCETIKTVTVNVQSAPSVQASADALICAGESAEISVTGDAARWVWETSDPAVNGGGGTEYTVNPSTTTDYIIHGYTDINCHSQDAVKVRVEATPNPAIVMQPSVLDVLDPTTILTDASTGNTTREWILSDGTVSNDATFVHTFPVTDTTLSFDITLIATSGAGCTDTTSTQIRVKRDHHVWAPTGVFLHDIDPRNREFRLWIDNIVAYELMIFNRNGECVFKTNDIEEAWDCTYKGELVTQGVYVWKVVYRHNDAPNREEMRKGNFMIYN